MSNPIIQIKHKLFVEKPHVIDNMYRDDNSISELTYLYSSRHDISLDSVLECVCQKNKSEPEKIKRIFERLSNSNDFMTKLCPTLQSSKDKIFIQTLFMFIAINHHQVEFKDKNHNPIQKEEYLLRLLKMNSSYLDGIDYDISNKSFFYCESKYVYQRLYLSDICFNKIDKSHQPKKY